MREQQHIQIKDNLGIIIVKDMSRLGRNCVQMGMLREQMCIVNIRLIAVNEDVASGLEFDDELLFEQSSIRLFERQ